MRGLAPFGLHCLIGQLGQFRARSVLLIFWYFTAEQSDLMAAGDLASRFLWSGVSASHRSKRVSLSASKSRDLRINQVKLRLIPLLTNRRSEVPTCRKSSRAGDCAKLVTGCAGMKGRGRLAKWPKVKDMIADAWR